MERRDYIEHIPENLKDFVEIKVIGDVYDIEITNVYDAMNQVLDNMQTATMDEAVVARWEKMLSITTPIDASLQSRRNAILSKFKTQPPINIATLKQLIEAYIGVEVDITQNEVDYTVNIRYRGLSQLPDLVPFYKTLYNVVPANMAVIIEYAYITWNEILSQTWGDLQNETWEQVLMGTEV